MTASKFHDKIRSLRPDPLRALGLKILQVNLGYQCNMACRHCHVSAGPGRTEAMERKTVDAVLSALLRNPIETLDITGGAPELNPHRGLASGREGWQTGHLPHEPLIFSRDGDIPEF
jgi:sulfatase maturation enzyme AslB (radical SAM superfamily)